LWGGVLGEEGPLGIVLGPGYPGKAFQEFQRALLSYQERGILLAINSRNNLSDVQEVFEKNPHMILKPSHFATIMANWNDKAENLVAIAQELNIGVESLVFFDDDAMNRELVRHALPGVLVPELASPPEEYVSILYGTKELNQLWLTEEDRARSRMAMEERERSQVQSVARSVEEYIAALGLVVTIRRNPTNHISRLAQLTQKTNQFNLTTERMTEGDIEKSIASSGMVFSGDVTDRYGAYGTTVLAIFEKESSHVATLRIFLMSCRVMGRGVEAVVMNAMIQALQREGFSEIHASFIPTAKNAPCKDFLSRMGFQFVGEGERGSIAYHLTTTDYQTDPSVVRPTIHTIYE
jgi:FkbH-like protein